MNLCPRYNLSLAFFPCILKVTVQLTRFPLAAAECKAITLVARLPHISIEDAQAPLSPAHSTCILVYATVPSHLFPTT